ncbi:MAG: leucine-rich repeat domain-containing protein, partial [Clostridia bacterium]|nr:leucine-rich repeat domain-containing protein [Clostridia bacterium]
MKQKKLTVQLCFWMVLVLILPLVSAHAATDERSGAVTDSISWELTEEGILYIRGEGEIPDYGHLYVDRKHLNNGPAPWKEVAEEIKELVIEEGITRIGRNAFQGPLYSFTKVTLPASLESVGYAAFGTAYGTTEVHIPSLEDWCEIAFRAKNDLGHFEKNTNPAFRADLYIGGELLTGKVIFPEELTKVNDLTFAGREGLTEVVLHDGVTELGNASFYESKDLQHVNLPEGIVVIPYEAFARCSALNGITLPQTVEKIEYAAFLKCTALETINIPAAVKEIETGALVNCEALNAVHITDIDAWCRIVFEIPYGLHPHFSEGASPLHYAKNLYLNGELVREVTVPEDITDLSDHAFAGCTSLEKVNLPEGLVVIGEGAFLGCTALKEIRIPSTVKAVQGYAFDGCTALERIYLESPFLIACKDYDEQHLDQWDEEFIYDEWGCCLRADVLIPEAYADGELGIIFATRTPEGVRDGYAVYGPCLHPETETKPQSHRCEEQVISLI